MSILDLATISSVNLAVPDSDKIPKIHLWLVFIFISFSFESCSFFALHGNNECYWQQLWAGHCEGIQCIDSTGNIILISTRNEILETTDGGYTWERKCVIILPVVIKQFVPFFDASHVCTSVLISAAGKEDKCGLFILDMTTGMLRQVLDQAGRGMTLSRISDSIVYAAVQTPPSLFVSPDCGRTWKFVSSLQAYIKNDEYVCSLTSFIRNGDRCFLVSCSMPAKCLLSIDHGMSWIVVATSFCSRATEAPYCFASSRNGNLYICLCNNFSPKPAVSVIRSTDYGDTWNGIVSPANLWTMAEVESAHALFVGQFEHLDTTFDLAPVIMSRDDGAHWCGTGNFPVEMCWSLQVTADQRKVLLASESGVYALDMDKLY